MKKLLVAFFAVLVSSMARASVTYTVTGAEFVMDSSVGTFQANSVTFGDIVGLLYTIEVKDTVTGNVCTFTNQVPTQNPLTAFPSSATVLTVITNDVTPKKTSAQTCLDKKNNVSTPDVKVNVSGVIGQTITP